MIASITPATLVSVSDAFQEIAARCNRAAFYGAVMRTPERFSFNINAMRIRFFAGKTYSCASSRWSAPRVSPLSK